MTVIGKHLFNISSEEMDKRKEMEKVYIYFILDEDQNIVKIGWSRCPEERLAGFRIANFNKMRILVSIPYHRKDIKDIEKEFHEVFKEYHIRNEWFRYDPIVKFAIEELIKNDNTRCN